MVSTEIIEIHTSSVNKNAQKNKKSEEMGVSLSSSMISIIFCNSSQNGAVQENKSVKTWSGKIYIRAKSLSERSDLDQGGG